MGRRSDHTREQLEQLIIDEGHKHLAEVGFTRFSAREVAKRVGYSIGTIYNVFGSYDRLILALNAKTLGMWAEALRARLEDETGDRIKALVDGYFDFAAANRHAWKALYDHHMVESFPLPENFVAAFLEPVRIIEGEVARALDAEPGEWVHTMTGSLVAIAHGHCTYALNGTFALFGQWDPKEAALQRIREALAEARASRP